MYGVDLILVSVQWAMFVITKVFHSQKERVMINKYECVINGKKYVSI